jgi:hypothetical protein
MLAECKILFPKKELKTKKFVKIEFRTFLQNFFNFSNKGLEIYKNKNFMKKYYVLRFW